MTGILPCTCSRTCQADSSCERIPHFQAHLDVPQDGQHPGTQLRTAACASHLGTMVVAMTAWARERDLTDARLTVLTIAPPPPESHSRARPHHGSAQTSGLIFSIIHLGEQRERPA
jgi:hypothetical protein